MSIEKNHLSIMTFTGAGTIRGAEAASDTTTENAAEAQNVNEAQVEECQTAHDSAQASVSGGMNMGEYAAVAGVANQAVSTQKEGGGASKAHLGSAAINGTLGAVSASRYMDCQSAIADCETKCGEEGNSATKAKNESNLKACTALSGQCSATGMQAMLSLAQSALGILAAKETGNPTKDPTKKETDPTPPNPNSRDSGGLPGSGIGTTTVLDRAPPQGRPNQPIPMLPQNPEPSDREPQTNPTPGPSPNAPTNEEPLLTDGEEGGPPLGGGVAGPGGDNSKPSSASGALSGNQMNDKGMDRLAVGKDKGYSNNQAEDELIITGGGSSGFSGSETAMGGNSLAGPMGGWGGSFRKQALNKKKPRSSLLQQKSALTQSFGQHDSIFKKASTLIKNYCNGGGAQCN